MDKEITVEERFKIIEKKEEKGKKREIKENNENKIAMELYKVKRIRYAGALTPKSMGGGMGMPSTLKTAIEIEKLKSLELHSIDINEIDISGCISLEYLDLSNNKFSKASEIQGIKSATQLKLLNLKKNHFYSMDEIFQLLKYTLNLVSIFLAFNPFCYENENWKKDFISKLSIHTTISFLDNSPISNQLFFNAYDAPPSNSPNALLKLTFIRSVCCLFLFDFI